MCAAIVGGKRFLECCPDALLDPLALAHAREEIDKRVPGLEPLCAAQLEDVRYGLEERHRVLGLDAGRILHLVRAIRQLLRCISNQTEASSGGKLEEIPEVDDDGDVAKGVLGQGVGRLGDVVGQTAATHGPEVQHVVQGRSDHADLLDDQAPHRGPQLCQDIELVPWPHLVVGQLLDAHGGGGVQGTCLH